jgi:NitT/TauT family transport system substrate-binding protein
MELNKRGGDNMRIRGALALAASAVLVIAGCGGGTSPSPSTAPSVTPSEEPSATPVTAEKCTGQKISFELSFIPNVQHAGFLVASAQGYYEDEGLDVEIRPGGQVDVTQDVADGTVDLGQVDYVDIVEARAAGVPIKAVAQTYKLPFFFWYSNKSSNITKVEDWKGKTVGAIQVGDYPERDAMMLAVGLDPKTDITVFQQTDFGTTDIIAGTVAVAEGVVFYHPAYLVGVDQKAWPGDFDVFYPAEHGADLASQTVAASEEFLASDPAAVKCFLRASVRGWMATFADAPAAVTDTMTFIPPGAIPEPHQQAAINDVLPIVGSGASDTTLLQLTPDKYASTIAQLKSLGYLTTDVDVASTYDSSFYDGMGPVTAP